MRVAVGGSLVWRQREYKVLFIAKESAMLQDEDGDEVEVAVDELERDARPTPASTRGLQNLSPQLQDVGPAMDPWLQACIRVEAARTGSGIDAAIETERAWLEMRLGKPVSKRTLERRLQDFRMQGNTELGVLPREVVNG